MKKACIICAAVLVVSLFTSCIVDVAPKSASFEVSLDLGGRSVADDVNVASIYITVYKQNNERIDEVLLTEQPWKASFTIDPSNYGEIIFNAMASSHSSIPMYRGSLSTIIDENTVSSLTIGVLKLHTIVVNHTEDLGTIYPGNYAVYILEEGADLISVFTDQGFSSKILGLGIMIATGQNFNGCLVAPPDLFDLIPWYPEPLTTYDIYISLDMYSPSSWLLTMDGENIAPLITITTGETIEDWAFSLEEDCEDYIIYDISPHLP